MGLHSSTFRRCVEPFRQLLAEPMRVALRVHALGTAYEFDERFLVLKGGDIRDRFGVNQRLEQRSVSFASQMRLPLVRAPDRVLRIARQ